MEPVVLEAAEEGREDLRELGVPVRLLDQPVRVLKEVEGVGEGDEGGGGGGEGEEGLEGGDVLGGDGVGEAGEVVGDPPVGFAHAQVRRHFLGLFFFFLLVSDGSTSAPALHRLLEGHLVLSSALFGFSELRHTPMVGAVSVSLRSSNWVER